MSVYVIVQGKIENRALLDQYVAKAGPAIKSHQGRTLAFDEDMTAFRAWYDSPEYQEILPLRLKAKLLFSLKQYNRRVSNGRLRSGF